MLLIFVGKTDSKSYQSAGISETAYPISRMTNKVQSNTLWILVSRTISKSTPFIYAQISEDAFLSRCTTIVNPSNK